MWLYSGISRYPHFRITDVTLAYLRAAGSTRDELLGRNVFDAFPDNPSDPKRPARAA
jgi:hypothetical protein